MDEIDNFILANRGGPGKTYRPGVTEPPQAAVTSGQLQVYVHVIARANGTGGVTTQQIQQQISVLNTGFATTGWSFNLAGVTTTANDAWYSMQPRTTAESSTTGWGYTTPSKAAAHARPRAVVTWWPTRRQKGRRPRAARPAAIPAPALHATTPSRTSWTTPTTRLTPAQDTRMDSSFSACRLGK